MAKGDAEDAGNLWAAAETPRESIGHILPAIDRTKREHGLERARRALDDSGETAAFAAWDEGAAMSWEKAVANTLGGKMK